MYYCGFVIPWAAMVLGLPYSIWSMSIYITYIGFIVTTIDVGHWAKLCLFIFSLSLSLNVVSEPQSLFLINLHCHFFRCIRAHTQDIMGISSIPRLLIYGFRSSQNHCFSITHTLAHHLSPNHALPALNTPSTSHMCLEPSRAIFFPRMLLI